ncbi:hypothetical protein [Rubrivivax gelatinosus]|uniref:hypothetical protein n=1 Tax=Rubrivivax gelatinosus TaxID=28068 RepID=UPI0002E0A76A|nr:hypothetical protein [Rubrivivax gelatinosus]
MTEGATETVVGEDAAVRPPAPAEAVAELPETPVAEAVPAPQPPAAPRIEPYALPTEALSALAADAGLQWVQSDADKVRAAQEAIAAEPKPVHVPREPKPVVVADEGPLVLVETRKDLSQLKLPFELGA